MKVAVIVPTYNECENVPLLIARLSSTLQHLDWEVVFVDDDSPDGTAATIAEYACVEPRIRLVHRIGRRGLASACVEGMLATSAHLLAVMDGDLQHDESILPQMFARLQQESLDVVVATRNANGGSMGEFDPLRVMLSRIGQQISKTVCKAELTDPMSGFFAIKRDFLLQVVHELQAGGFKILVDLLSSSRRPVRLAEVGYTFGQRRHGESKLDVVVGMEYLSMVLNKLLGNVVPAELALYLVVGGLGLGTYFALSWIFMRALHMVPLEAQGVATFSAMTENFVLNNRLTFRDRRLRGRRVLSGALNFLAISGFGAWANLLLTSTLLHNGLGWAVAGSCGIVLGSVWNLSIASQFTWRLQRRSPSVLEGTYTLAESAR